MEAQRPARTEVVPALPVIRQPRTLGRSHQPSPPAAPPFITLADNIQHRKGASCHPPGCEGDGGTHSPAPLSVLLILSQRPAPQGLFPCHGAFWALGAPWAYPCFLAPTERSGVAPTSITPSCIQQG